VKQRVCTVVQDGLPGDGGGAHDSAAGVLGEVAQGRRRAARPSCPRCSSGLRTPDIAQSNAWARPANADGAPVVRVGEGRRDLRLSFAVRTGPGPDWQANRTSIIAHDGYAKIMRLVQKLTTATGLDAILIEP